MALSLNTYSHCGSCGTGGAEEDHHESEDTTHHDHDKKFQEAGKKKEAIMNGETESPKQ